MAMVACVERNDDARGGYYVHLPPCSDLPNDRVDIYFTDVYWGPPVYEEPSQGERDRETKIKELESAVAERDATIAELRAEVERLKGRMHGIDREELLAWLKEQRAEAVDCHANAETDEWQAMGKGAALMIDEIIDHIKSLGKEAADGGA